MKKAPWIPLLAALWLASCGGGGGTGGVAAPPTTPPTALAYARSDVLYRAEAPILPNAATVEGGAPTGFQVAPALPSGLAIDAATGLISGTPDGPAAKADYVVTAANPAGSTQATVAIEVRWAEAKSLHAAETIDDADLRHFLRRTHWGVREINHDALVQVGLPAYVDAMLQFPPVGSTPQEQTAAQILVNATDPPGQEGMFPTRRELSMWWLTLMITNPNTFQEVLAFFWHDHFATSSDPLGAGNLYWMKNHVEIFRGGGAGNLKDLLLAVSRDPAMLRWLDGITSTKTAPNENYGREFFELFGLGADNGYTQDDIVQAARAFTGYRQVVLDADTGLLGVVFSPSRHDDGDKTLFGETIPGQNATDDYEAVVDITLQNRDVAGWIAKSLLEYFCMPQPAPELVDQFAQRLRDENYELAPALKALFLSEAFFSDEARRAFVTSPVETAVGFVNATGLVIRPSEFESRLDQMGQVPTRPPTVDGWPGGSQWLSAQGMLDRANLVRSCIANRTLQDSLGIDVADLLPPGGPSAGEVVDALALRLGVEPSASERAAYVDFLDTERLPNGDVVPSPFDPTNPTHVDDRVRGLLYVLAQHPQAMKR